MRRVRCAIYTRKSSEEGLEQEFNSLDAQREACAAYIASQKHEGWVLLPDHYDDGGVSGGTLERDALHRLMAQVDEGLIDQIVVYKIDRLTRSLADFAKLVDRLDRAGASFVSVTQSFNTATSMGRLTLNVLLSFAQFEREVTAERIRDKIAASKKKGLWMGGNVPLGYEADGRTLTINLAEAETVRMLYQLYDKLGSVTATTAAAGERGLRSKRRSMGRGGNLLGRGHVHAILTNPIYAGLIRHKRAVYDGMHEAIIPPGEWEAIQQRLSKEARCPRGTNDERNDKANRSLLCGKVFDQAGKPLTPSHANKDGKRYRYYVSHDLIRSPKSDGLSTGWRVPAVALEQQVAAATIAHLRLLLLGIHGSSRSISDLAGFQRRIDEIDDQFDRVAIWCGVVAKVQLQPG